ncbi:ORF121 [Spodoptera exigua multiple nucleopolyhedrovirus]|uniref:ORF121 n=1 Tax=Spodoptera exigua nuclear polyhedrosis virus (strain US) TaxID=31506 RepID=Q9J816_NPVSE|nr:ORF121 [Spodoptera exigua multiple nucleopolyhedrovirus]AAF33650.1 ORF121 [Spodoptera exigua multiple nucleopolyhedrovirus]
MFSFNSIVVVNAMFAFKYPMTGDFISVYFDLKHFYFDCREIINIMDGVVEKRGRRKIINKMIKLRFLRPHQVVELLHCFLYTKRIQRIFSTSSTLC